MKECIKNTEGKEKIWQVRLNNWKEVIEKIEKDIEDLKQGHRLTREEEEVLDSSVIESRENRSRRNNFKGSGESTISDDRLSSNKVERIRRMVTEKKRREEE